EMTVEEVEDQIKIKLDKIYIITPNKDMTLIDGVLQLSSRPSKPYAHMPINHFFTSLAEKHKEASIGIVLSGSATDGTLGLKAIKLAGGLTFAQDETAKFQSMPKSAIAEGVVDLVLSPEEIAKELANLSSQKDIYLSAIRDLNEEAIQNAEE